MKAITLILLLCLYGCANNQPHQSAPLRQSGTQQNSNGVISAPIGELTPQIGLTNNETKNTAGANINQAEVIADGYKSIVLVVLLFSFVIIAGFAAVVIILVRGHQKHEREMMNRN